jgi:hypothetical protein
MTAISRSKVNIYIVNANTAPSALVATTDVFKGDIKSYDISGGEKDVESDPVFGGFVDKEKPITQGEITFEIIPLIEPGKANRWDELAYTKETVSGKVVYTMATEGLTGTDAVLPGDRMVVIEATHGTDRKSLAYNNCSVTVLDVSHEADDNRTYSMTLKFAPTTGAGVSNFMTGALAATALPNWTSLKNN